MEFRKVYGQLTFYTFMQTVTSFSFALTTKSVLTFYTFMQTVTHGSASPSANAKYLTFYTFMQTVTVKPHKI